MIVEQEVVRGGIGGSPGSTVAIQRSDKAVWLESGDSVGFNMPAHIFHQQDKSITKNYHHTQRGTLILVAMSVAALGMLLGGFASGLLLFGIAILALCAWLFHCKRHW